MTYFHIKTDRRLSADVENALRDDMVDLLYLVRKPAMACMFDIESGCNLRMGDGSAPCVLMEVQCASMPEDDDVRAFTKKAAALFHEVLGAQLKNIYVVFAPMPCFATGDVLKD